MAVNECNGPVATWMKAVLVVVPKQQQQQQGLAFVVIEREDGSRSGETAPGLSRQQQRRGRRTKPMASLCYCFNDFPPAGTLLRKAQPARGCALSLTPARSLNAGPG